MDKINEPPYHIQYLTFTEVDMGILEWFTNLSENSQKNVVILVIIVALIIGALIDRSLKLKFQLKKENLELEKQKIALQEAKEKRLVNAKK